MRIELPERTPSLNQWQRWHWAKRSRYKSKLAREVAKRACGSKIDTAPVYITITRHSSRQLDVDNLIGGCKALVDALTTNGFIVDDSPEWVVIEYRQAPGRGMTVEIEPYCP